ncbi:MAG: hypothetical protein ACXAC2_14170 [Candidatus Kariarchaeaceae archaeon]|jgi:hypothetical protein
MNKEEKLTKYADKITANSTTLLMVAVVAYFITLLFGFVPTYNNFGQVNGTVGYILGSGTLGSNNLIAISGFGAVLALINAILMAIVRLFAGLSFAAVCFDESKNIWFRVVCVAALMLIMFGGLNIF